MRAPGNPGPALDAGFFLRWLKAAAAVVEREADWLTACQGSAARRGRVARRDPAGRRALRRGRGGCGRHCLGGRGPGRGRGGGREETYGYRKA
jgi:hypothetical protein